MFDGIWARLLRWKAREFGITKIIINKESFIIIRKILNEETFILNVTSKMSKFYDANCQIHVFHMQ
jgi:hypothetical protein